MASEAPKGGSLGVPYVLARWEEMTDPQARWWTRGTGLGVRLRIEELLKLSEARQDGVIYASSIDRLRGQAKKVLGRTRSFLDDRFEPLRELLAEALSGSSRLAEEGGLGALWPGSGAHASLWAGLKFLESVGYLEAITEELEKRALSAKGVQELEALDEMIELLDAELIGDGHSRRWRQDFYIKVSTRVTGGSGLSESIHAELENQREMRNFDVVVGVERFSEPIESEVQLPYSDEAVLHTLIDGWNAQPDAEELSFPFGGLMESVEASDCFGAAEMAVEQFDQWSAVWQLQGAVVVLRDRVIVYDGSRRRAEIVKGEKSLNLKPKNLKGFRMDTPGISNGTPQELADGLLQLAQARVSPVGAALADLWGVAEVCFSGVAVGSRDQAGSVIGGIAEFTYLTDRLEWLGQRLEIFKVQPEREPGQRMAEWALELVTNQPETLLPTLKVTDPLAWLRAEQVARWKEDRFLHRDLMDVRERVEAVCARAYLIRNFYIHSGRAKRSAALAVTLPVFAELLRVSLGFALQSDAEPVVSARLAMLRARQLAFEYKEEDAANLSALAETASLRQKQGES